MLAFFPSERWPFSRRNGGRIQPEYAVLSTIREYFPGATPLAAEKDVKANRTKYEVLVQYKAIQLEVDLAEDGTILDVDMER